MPKEMCLCDISVDGDMRLRMVKSFVRWRNAFWLFRELPFRQSAIIIHINVNTHTQSKDKPPPHTLEWEAHIFIFLSMTRTLCVCMIVQ